MKWMALLLVMLLGLALAARTFLERDYVYPPAQSPAPDYPVVSLVMPVDGPLAFEAVPQNLEVLQQAEHLRIIRGHGGTRVLHLVLHLDCHYYFADNGKVYVTTWSSPGKPPRLVETLSWSGSPREFHGYHTELLPEA
jgi:hypothetical protein